MSQTRLNWAKAVALTDYMPAFRSGGDIASWGWKKISTTKSSKKATEQVYPYTGFGLPMETNELEMIHYDSMYELDPTTFTMKKYTLATMFSDELIADRREHMKDIMKEAGTAMRESHQYIRDLIMASHFNNAFSGATVWDGSALCDTHTLKSGGTLDNDLTAADLSHTSLWLAWSYFTGTISTQRGLLQQTTPVALICHTSEEKNARVIKESNLETLAATIHSQDKNVLKGKFDIITNPFLTDIDNWFLVDDKFKSDLLFFERQAPKTDTEADFDREGLKIKNVQRFASGPKDFPHIVGTPGAS